MTPGNFYSRQPIKEAQPLLFPTEANGIHLAYDFYQDQEATIPAGETIEVALTHSIGIYYYGPASSEPFSHTLST